MDWLLRSGLLALGVMLVAGCVSLPVNPENMSPEQIKEWVRDKSITAMCTTMNTPYGRGIVVHVGMDKGVVGTGAVSVNDQCQVSITNAPAPPK